MKYPLLKPRLFRIELLSHDAELKPAGEVLQSITETLFARAIKAGRKMRVYIRCEYENEPPQIDDWEGSSNGNQRKDWMFSEGRFPR